MSLDPAVARGYRSPAQIARVVTEAWASANLYCLECPAQRLPRTPTNEPVVDLRCNDCGAVYQLKSRRSAAARRIRDAAYDPMLSAIRSGTAPHLLLMHYSREDWRVVGLEAIPGFAMTQSALQRCAPLSAKARRAGWVGCNILLFRLPPDARIPIITAGQAQSSGMVRSAWRRVSGLRALKLANRGWALDVLQVARSLGRFEFALQDVYDHEEDLAALYPRNKHIRPKIRQQLQVLRDSGLLQFLGGGRYRFRGDGGCTNGEG